ncbi:MAG: response regulator transcription factor [Chloroherpetonaceae bacterium]|nr:response regulator transcription factor [Chthonomonadaceae bacterium]MDW8208415.1 response regulator transcription factor [Chloroherpetonaceae bacterium]
MQPISILLADDDVIVRQCLRRAVEADPRFEIRWEADNGLQALILAQQHQPHLILIDAQMPRMDGIEATRCLRQRNHRQQIIVMSVYEQLRAQALAAGADAFITKDCGCEGIREALYRQVFGEQAPRGDRGQNAQ